MKEYIIYIKKYKDFNISKVNIIPCVYIDNKHSYHWTDKEIFASIFNVSEEVINNNEFIITSSNLDNIIKYINKRMIEATKYNRYKYRIINQLINE